MVRNLNHKAMKLMHLFDFTLVTGIFRLIFAECRWAARVSDEKLLDAAEPNDG